MPEHPVPEWMQLFGGLPGPEWVKPLFLILPGVAAVLALMWGCSLLFGLAFPKAAAMARTTARKGRAEPLFWVLLIGGSLCLAVFTFIPYGTLGNDIQELQLTGLETMTLLAAIFAVWTASISISDELEGRTALTLLSKPIGRRSFVAGKFLGVLGPVFLMFAIFSAIYLCSISYKVVYDARENSLPAPTYDLCLAETVQTLPGLLLRFLEVAVMTSISVAISTRLPMLANGVICLAVFALGHVTPQLVQSAAVQETLPLVTFVARLIATVLPALDYFNVETAIATKRTVPVEYLAWSCVYCGLYCAIAMLLALFAFEDRDLA